MGVILVAMFCTSPCRVLRNRPASSTVDQLVNFGYWLRTSAGSINGPVKMGLGVSQGGPPSRATDRLEQLSAYTVNILYIGMIYDQTPFPSGVSSQKDLHCQESRERREVKQPD